MARTERNTVEYFPHDSAASNGDTMTILQSQFGNNGYAVWFKLLEKLARTENHVIDCNNNIKWKLLVAYLGTDEITTVDILKLLVEMQAIDGDLWASKLIWCQKLVENLSEVYRNRRRQKPSKPIIPCSKPITTPDNKITTGSYTQSRVEYSRVDKTPISPLRGILFDTFWEVYPKKVDKQDAQKVFIKLNPTQELLDIIIKAIGRQKLSVQWQDGIQFVPSPAKWLRGKHWEDDLPLNIEKGGYNGKIKRGLPTTYKPEDEQ